MKGEIYTNNAETWITEDVKYGNLKMYAQYSIYLVVLKTISFSLKVY
jgi:hypothetical protein